MANGDVFLTEPVLSTLVREGHEVEVESRVPELVQGGPWKVTTTRRATQSDPVQTLIDLDEVYESRPQVHVQHAYADMARSVLGGDASPLRLTPRAPYLYLTPQELEACVVYAHRTPYVLFHLRSMRYRRFRQIHGVDWARVMDETARFAGVVRLPDDFEGDRRHEVVATPTLRDAIPAIYGASLFVGMDSAPAHMAASLGVPAIILFGSVFPGYRYLPGAQVAGLSGRCIHAGCYHHAAHPDEPRCLMDGEPHAYCCTEYDTGKVLDKIAYVAGGGGATSSAVGTDLRIDSGAWWRQARRYRLAR